MEMVAVIGIGIGPQHHAEPPARTVMHRMQIVADPCIRTGPAVAYGKARPVGQHERRDVDGIGMTMLG